MPTPHKPGTHICARVHTRTHTHTHIHTHTPSPLQLYATEGDEGLDFPAFSKLLDHLEVPLIGDKRREVGRWRWRL